MPLYEWECLACEITFEDLASVSEGQVGRACPSCGRTSPRVVSTFAIASGGGSQPQPAANAATAASGAKPPPICLRYPHIPLLCHMDQPTAERAVAYAHGRGAEYDDKKGTREELRKKRGLPPPPPPAPPAHTHHNPRRHQSADDGGQTKSAGRDHGRTDAAHGHDHAAAGHAHSKGQKGVKSSGAPVHGD